MKLHSLLLVLFLLVSFRSFANDIIPVPVPYNNFRSGEQFTYQLRYGFIIGGTVKMALSEVYENNTMMYHAVTIAQTSGMADKVYGVKDIYESWFDKKTGLPYRQIRNIKEGHYRWYNEATHNHQNNTVLSKKSGLHNVPPSTFDIVSTLYYIRRVDFSKLKNEDIITINMYFADEVSPFRMRYRGTETIATKFGKVRCIRISPVVQVGRVFKSPDDLTFWLTDDGNYIPIQVRMNIRIVGAVYVELMEYQNLKKPLGIEK
jgi:hypothetical protein